MMAVDVAPDVDETVDPYSRIIDVAFQNASKLSNYTPEQLAGASKWVVKLRNGVTAETFESRAEIAVASAFPALGNTYFVHAGGLSPDNIAGRLSGYGDVEYFYPQVPLQLEKHALPNDPLVPLQWHLRNTGQETSTPLEANIYGAWGADLGVEEAWKIATGNGVLVGVLDDGFAYYHPDLDDNYDTTLDFDFTRVDTDPRPTRSADSHGTAVTGIIAAEANNGIGGAGVAYDATAAGLRILGQDPLRPVVTSDVLYDALLYRNQQFDVYNNSWGFFTGGRFLAPLDPIVSLALIEGARLGRDGLGSIHVFSSGNDADVRDNVNHSELANSPFVISVGGLNPRGSDVFYAEAGPSLFVVAPTAENPPGSGIVTTDQPGTDGYNSTLDTTIFEHDGDFLPDLNYTSTFNGTSAAAPMVTGVVALMIDAARQNGIELSLRDVQHILARSSTQVDPQDANWAVNTRPLFTDPLEDDMGVPIGEENPNYFEPFPDNTPGTTVSGVPQTLDTQHLLMRNGAGFFVHDGFDYGYGHGAINAKMAVELASSWRTVGTEANIKNVGTLLLNNRIPAAEVINIPGRPDVIIPGGVDGRAGFGNYFNLWLNPPDDLPDPLPENTRGEQAIEFSVQEGGVIEWIEVTIDGQFVDFEPDQANISSQLRLTLISPDGTHSELTNWSKIANRGAITPDGQINFTFTTNRHWGERTEGVGKIDTVTGDLIESDGTWQLAVENWSNKAFNFDATVNFRTSQPSLNPNVPTGRIQGSIGLDTNNDGDFNFLGLLGEVEALDSGEEIVNNFRLADPEPMAAGIRAYVDTDNDGNFDPQEPWMFTTADGNYYFDLPYNLPTAEPYRVRFELPDGYTAIGDTMHEFRLGLQDDGTTLTNAYIEGNFLIRPETVTFIGNVASDFDANGVPNQQDVPLAGFRVFVDTNENGIHDFIDVNLNGRYDEGVDSSFEPVAISDANGDYLIEMSVDDNQTTDFFGGVNIDNTLFVGAGYYTIMLSPQVGWVPTGDDISEVGFAGPQGASLSPGLAFHRVFADPGETLEGLDFTADTVPGAQLGTISGFVFNDLDQNGVRTSSDEGIEAATVFLDLDNSGDLSAADLMTSTNSMGAYLFEGLVPGFYDIHVIPPSSFSVSDQRTPIGAFYDNVSVSAGEVVGGGSVNFAFFNPNAIPQPLRDYGDLPGPYKTLLAGGGASHGLVAGFYLGSGLTEETDGQPSANADADAMDDGVSILNSISAGSLVRLDVEASTNSLFFQGWIDFNDDGDFDDPGEHLEFRNAAGALLPFGRQLRLETGINEVSFRVPEAVSSNALAARFRYGEGGVVQFNKPNGHALMGEVEDYILGAAISTAVVQEIPGDFNGDLVVDASDYQVWKSSFGSTLDLRADANGDRKVDLADYTIWRSNLGGTGSIVQTISAPPAALTLDAGSDEELALYISPELEASDSSSSYATNDATDVDVVDLAFYAADDDADTTADGFSFESPESGEEALVVALEEEFGASI